MSNDNLKRFGLHLAFGAASAVCLGIVSGIGALHLDPTIQAIVVSLATAAASFFRSKE
jgi:hypothetical protein